jgi:hypothetical protein
MSFTCRRWTMPKAGLDDHFAAETLTVEDLRNMRRRFDPADLARERLAQDTRLRDALETRREYLRKMPVKGAGGGTRVAFVRVLTLEVEKSGQLVERNGRPGVRVVMDRRTAAERAQKSLKAIRNAIEALEGEEAPTLCRDNAGRKAEKAGAFVLFTDFTEAAQKGTHNGETEGVEEEGSLREGKRNPLSLASYPTGVYPSARLSEKVPALRHPKVILYWAIKNGERVVADAHYVWRLAEQRAEIMRHALDVGPRVPVGDLMPRFATERTRQRDFVRRVLRPLTGRRFDKDPATGRYTEMNIGPPLAELERDPDGTLMFCPRADWLEALEEHRERTDEIEDARRQSKKHADQRKNYRERRDAPTDPMPELAGPEKVREIVEAAEKRDRAARIEEQRRKVGTTPETFLEDALHDISGFGWREVRALWMAKGGKPEDLRRAVKDPYRFNREGGKGALYVERLAEGTATDAVPEREPAPVTVLREPENLTKPDISLAAPTPPNLKKPETASPPAEDWRSHPLDCECPDCAAPLPTYARAWRGA